MVVTACTFASVAPAQEDGPARYLYPNGQVSSEGVLVNGRPEGYWRTYYETGALRSEGNRKRFEQGMYCK